MNYELNGLILGVLCTWYLMLLPIVIWIGRSHIEHKHKASVLIGAMLASALIVYGVVSH